MFLQVSLDMEIVNFSSTKWREIALEYKPKKNFDRIMHETYGLKRVILKDDVLGINYFVVDAAKYTMFLLKWS